MKTIKVEITGVSPLLMNNPISMIEKAQNAMKQTTKHYDLAEDAKKLVYKKKSGSVWSCEVLFGKVRRGKELIFIFLWCCLVRLGLVRFGVVRSFHIY